MELAARDLVPGCRRTCSLLASSSIAELNCVSRTRTLWSSKSKLSPSPGPADCAGSCMRAPNASAPVGSWTPNCWTEGPRTEFACCTRLLALSLAARNSSSASCKSSERGPLQYASRALELSSPANPSSCCSALTSVGGRMGGGGGDSECVERALLLRVSEYVERALVLRWFGG
eukprot:381420-Rhodomonas_salina.2